MKILFAASEARPFIASGGLADVAGALPKALCKQGEDCRVVIPLYSDMKPQYRERLAFVTAFTVQLSWRRQYCGLFTVREGDVTYYLLDNEQYFKRSGLYGYFDDAERYAFFSMAVLELCKEVHFFPDILHANDWQTALVPIYLNLFYQQEDARYRRIRSVFTIHNIQYQGQFGLDTAGDVFSIPWEKRGAVEYDGCVNLLKGAIECADRVNTVSPTYAREILDPYFGHGLDRFLRERREKLSGILNGIDQQGNDPAVDPNLFHPYDREHLEGKEENKRGLQELFGLDQKAEGPLLGIVSRLVSHKGMDLIACVLEEMLALGVQVAALGSGDYAYEQFFLQAAQRHPGQVGVRIGFLPNLASKIYGGADLFLMPSQSEPCGLAQMIAARYGALPIVRLTGGLADSIQDFGQGQGEDGGNGFTFYSYNAHDMLEAVSRAVEAYRNPARFWAMRQAAMGCDFSWDRSAGAYLSLYSQAMGMERAK